MVDPEALFNEIEYLEGLEENITPDRLMISDRAQVIMPYHKVLDQLKEESRGKK